MVIRLVSPLAWLEAKLLKGRLNSHTTSGIPRFNFDGESLADLTHRTYGHTLVAREKAEIIEAHLVHMNRMLAEIKTLLEKQAADQKRARLTDQRETSRQLTAILKTLRSLQRSPRPAGGPTTPEEFWNQEHSI
jgi:hypothetical protein